MSRVAFRLAPWLLTPLLMACPASPPAPTFEGVEPTSLQASAGGEVSLAGAGWLPQGTFDFDQPARSSWSAPVSVTASNGTIAVILSAASWVDSSHAKATVPPGLAPGVYSLELTTPRGAVLTLPDALTLLEDPVDDFDAGVITPCTDVTFADDDGDGFGRPGSEAMLCGPGRVDAGGDCNDVDALVSPAGTEVCNGVDDNCNAQIDEGVCPTDAGRTWTRIRSIENQDTDLVAVAAYGPETVWVGGNDKLYHRNADGGFVERSSGCPSRINALWAAPNGRVFVAGGNPGIGRITTATPTSNCTGGQMLPDPVAGLSGVVLADGGAEVNGVLRDGRRFTWDGTGAPRVTGQPQSILLTHASGPEGNLAFATGTQLTQQVVARLRSDGGTTLENLSTLGALTPLRNVSSSTSMSCVVVGDNGELLRRTRGWERLVAPVNNNLTAVKAFSPGRFYLSTDVGGVHFWNGAWQSWPTANVAIRAMDGVDELHLWLVGDNGVIIKSP
ncbi:MAG: putative metal-binding motif-containing protein [Myxococcaceae bacterium]